MKIAAVTLSACLSAAFSAALAATVLPAAAQAVSERVEARSGEEVRVGWIGSLGPDCKADPLPKVTPASLARHGQIKLVEGEVETDSFPDCPGAKLPAIVIFYTSAPDFTGTDGFTLSAQGTGEASTRAYEITVE